MEVKIHQPEKNSLECKMEVTFAVENLDKRIQKKLVELSKTVKMSGFRPGKVPMHMVQSKYADDIKWEIVEEDTQKVYREALVQENLTPAGMGVFTEMNSDDLEKLSFTAVFERMPEVEMTQLEALEINRYIPLIKDEDIEEQLTTYQNYSRQWVGKIIGSPAEEGDQIIIDFIGQLEDGSTFKGNSANDFPIILGEKKMLPEFEQALYATTEGEQKKISFTFPKEYGEKDLSDKKVNFTITVKAINRPDVPALDDAEFLKTMRIENGDSEQLKSLARMECSLQLEQVLNTYNHQLVQNALLASHDFIVPKVHIDEETKAMTQEAHKQHQQHQAPEGENQNIPELSEEEKKSIEVRAYEHCKLSLVYRAISQKYEIKPDAKAIAQHLQQLCQQYFNGDFKALEKSPHLPQVKREIEQRDLLRQIHHTIYQNAKVTEIQKHKSDIDELSQEIFAQP